MTSAQPVRFHPFRSTADPSFWLDHNSRKLNDLKLSEEGVPLHGYFTISRNNSSAMRFDVVATDAPTVRRNEAVRSIGKIYSLNTIESFKKCDKNEFLNEASLDALLACCGVGSSGDGDGDETFDDPNLGLVPSVCLTYCDLKSNMTVYWFAFPALAPKSGCGVVYSSEAAVPQSFVADVWGPEKCNDLSKSFHQFRVSQEKELSNIGDSVWCPPFFMLLEKSMKCLPLNKASYDSLSEDERQQLVFGFVDPNLSSDEIAASDAPLGWTLRNLIAYISLRLDLGGANVKFLSFRPSVLRRISTSNESETDFEDVGDEIDCNKSLLAEIGIPLASDYQWQTDNNKEYRCVGWELNAKGKPGPRSVDLRPLVSPSHLARQANDLNLRLMKWRALPALDVERLSQLKVLLLGAGTLGCSVARTLLGWGIRNITFVDSGRVSYSNPVRQSLFGIEDCKEGGKYKAVAAAESLVAIAGPDVKSEGVVLTIPMPGHSFGGGKDGAAEIDAVKKDVDHLHALIDQHDVIFLLTDTRESRWLPTVMALATDTPLINSALGLDSWLVMRHGPSSSSLSSKETAVDATKLGCYFCSDVVAPENSTRDRTLDQQCTVTRPGLAPIAASMATELMVAMFHHPLGNCAPAPEKKDINTTYNPVDDGSSASSTALGLLPHQIRGTVVTYSMMTPTVPAFPACSACSDLVVNEYKRNGFEFVKCVCCDMDGKYLEGISGLTKFREDAANKMDECIDWDEDEED
jgi:ubiquitin-like modifier-activating enzyme ATG7